MARKNTDTVIVNLPFVAGVPELEEDLTVGLNGKLYQIQRGRPVEVPRVLSEIIDRREMLTRKAAAFAEEKRFTDAK